MRNNKGKKTKKLSKIGPARSRGGTIFNIAFLFFIGAFMALPLIFVTSNAFKPFDELFIFPPRFFVRNPTFDNFQDVSVLMGWSWVPISRYFMNTFLITLVSTAGHVMIASSAGYVLAKREFPGRKLLSKVIVISLMFSPAVTQIPGYMIMSNLHLIDTQWSLILPAFAAPIGLFLMQQFMVNIPDSLIESAKIDGASQWNIFIKIIMPLVKPAWLTVIIFSFQLLWGATGDIYIFTEELKPLNYALNQILGGGIARVGAGSAVAFLMLIPPILVFVFSQKKILYTMASSGIKE